jgi:hypothetical protein
MKVNQQLQAGLDGLHTLMIEVIQKTREMNILPEENFEALIEPIRNLITEIDMAKEEPVTIGLADCQSKAEQFRDISQAVGALKVLSYSQTHGTVSR